MCAAKMEALLHGRNLLLAPMEVSAWVGWGPAMQIFHWPRWIAVRQSILRSCVSKLTELFSRGVSKLKLVNRRRALKSLWVMKRVQFEVKSGWKMGRYLSADVS